MKVGATGVTGSNDPKGIAWTGPGGPSHNRADDDRDEIIKLLRSIDKNVKEINAKLK